MSELVERVVLAAVTNPDLPMPLQGGKIPTGSIYFKGDTVKISKELAERWDAGGITTTQKILDQPENRLLARQLEEKNKRNIVSREKQNIQRQDSPEAPAPTPKKKAKEK